MRPHMLIEKTHDVTAAPDLLTALGMDNLFLLREGTVTDYLTCDLDVLTRRSLLFRDTLRIPGLFELIGETVTRLSAIREILRLQSHVSEADRGLYSLRRLGQYFEVIDTLAAFYAAHGEDFRSPAYRALLADLAAIAASEEYARLKANTAPVMAEVERVKSITVGFNVDAALVPYEAGLLSVNDDYIASGGVIDRILRLDTRAESPLRAMTPLAPARTDCTPDEYVALTGAAYAALSKVFRRQVRRIEPEVNRYIKEHVGHLIDLIPDLTFIRELSDIQRRLSRAGFPLTVPTYCPRAEKQFDAEGLYNPVLALHKFENGDPAPIIPSDLCFDESGGIFLLTGPNSGGKTVFLKSVGIVQIMAQVGMMVPAHRLTVSPVSGLYVEFPTYTTERRAGGRLEYECAEIRRMFDSMDEYALVLLDEAFSSTSPDEAVALAAEVLKALSLLGARGVYVSHYHLLTQCLEELNASDFGSSRFDFLAADITEGNTRTYRITRRPPDGHSYAGSIAARYGIRADSLASRAPKTQERTRPRAETGS